MKGPAFVAPFVAGTRVRSSQSLQWKNSKCIGSDPLPCGAHQMRACVHDVRPNEPSNAIKYGAIQHIGLLVEDTAVAKQFYMDVLGMVDDHEKRNPELPFAGTFLRAGSSQIHLMELPTLNPKEGRPEHGGRDTHAAITIQSLDPLIASLERHEIKYTFSKSGRRAVFVRDSDMNALEFVEQDLV